MLAVLKGVVKIISLLLPEKMKRISGIDDLCDLATQARNDVLYLCLPASRHAGEDVNEYNRITAVADVSYGAFRTELERLKKSCGRR
jgi:hypothetical protein